MFYASFLPCLCVSEASAGSRGGGALTLVLSWVLNQALRSQLTGGSSVFDLQQNFGSQVVPWLQTSLLASILKIPSLPVRFCQPLSDIPNSPPNMCFGFILGPGGELLFPPGDLLGVLSTLPGLGPQESSISFLLVPPPPSGFLLLSPPLSSFLSLCPSPNCPLSPLSMFEIIS